MITPNSPDCQQEGAQGEEDEKAGGRRKGGPTRTPMPGAYAPTSPTRLGMSDSTPQEGQRGPGISHILSQ